MKIGILTFFRPINYGAFLQAYALSHRLDQEMDMDAEIIDFHMPVEDEYYENKLKLGENIPRVLNNRKRFKTFRQALTLQNLSNTSCCSSDILEFISFVKNKYDVIIAGSDEIWKVDGYRGFPSPYFLPGDLQCKKVSYAASGRTPFEVLSKDKRVLLEQLLNDFDYIGVRDKKTEKGVKTVVDDKSKVHLNFDPSFVYEFSPNPERGRKILADMFHLSGNKKVIAIMYYENASDNPSLERYLKNKYGRKYDFISLYNWSMSFQNNPKISPLDWVDLISAVDGVISTFFHGICFSIIAGTPFYAIEKRARNNEESKLYDLLNQINFLDFYSLGLEDVIKQNRLDEFMKIVDESGRIDFSFVLDQARDEFSQFVNTLRNIVLC